MDRTELVNKVEELLETFKDQVEVVEDKNETIIYGYNFKDYLQIKIKDEIEIIIREWRWKMSQNNIY